MHINSDYWIEGSVSSTLVTFPSVKADLVSLQHVKA